MKQPAMEARIRISADYFKAINYALFHNGVTVCNSVDITNESETPVTDARLACEGAFFLKKESGILPPAAPGETLRLTSFEIAPDPSKLAGLTERIVTDFTLTLTSNGETVSAETFPVELMPYDHWLGESILPQTIASFVTPNHPLINELLLSVGEQKKKISGSSVLSAYQSGNINEVRAQVASVFAALHKKGIIYRSLPASFETLGQRVTMPDQVLATKIGNCLELSLLTASVLEAMGLNSGIVICKDHAYLAVWLVDDCSMYSLCDDPSFLEKKISKGIDEMLVLECTQVTHEDTSFEGAVRIAETQLADHSSFRMFIDIRRCRLQQILPLPARVRTDGKWGFEENGVRHGECKAGIEVHDRYDLSRISGTSGKEVTRFDIWERKLLDFSLRNSLLNIRLRWRAVQFISFDIDRIEDLLQDGEEYCICPKPDIEFQPDLRESLVRSKLFPQLNDLVRSDIAHRRLHTYQAESETKNVLKNIYRSTKNTIEETGANPLFLSIGLVRWFETPQSEAPRYAPLLLLPVEMVYKKGSYFIRSRDEGITINITLVEFLRQNYDIRIGGLDPLPRDRSGVDVPLILAAVRDALKDQKGWDVEEECILGTFSFSKFLMWNDIHNNRGKLLENRVIASLAENRLTWVPEPVTSDLKDIDNSISPAGTALPVPVDSSQMAAVIEGGKGNPFILYGPPGTGKSQTITNLIANALYNGKRVLFVAEKMAALSVVQKRLEKIGLDPFCLELHSNKSTKRHVLQQLDKALKVTHIVPPSEYAEMAEKIFAKRKELIANLEGLHRKDSSDGLSLFDCILGYGSISGEPLECFTPSSKLDAFIAKEGISAVGNLLGSGFETVVRLVGQPSTHPLKGLHLNSSQLMDCDALVKSMKKDTASLEKTAAKADALKDTLALRERILLDNSESIFEEDPEDLHREWREIKAKWLVARIFAKRKFLEKLRRFNSSLTESEVDSLIDSLIVYRSRHLEIEGVWETMRRWRGDSAMAEGIDTEGMTDGSAWHPLDRLPENPGIEDFISSLKRWSSNPSRMRDWLHWSELCDTLEAAGLSCVSRSMEEKPQEPGLVRQAFLKALFKSKAESKICSSETLMTFEGMIFDEKVSAYRNLAEEFQNLTRKELYARLASRVPRLTEGIDSSGEFGILNRNISNGGRGLSLRDLFDQIPTLLPRLCPCLLMSPMSVAQYIDISAEKFDLVVFDEASQMPTSESVGAIARGKSLIVVGDSKQMPPTSFFTSTNTDIEEAAVDDLESILEDCNSLGMPSLQLSWHYRSRHESLIAFSNNEYYDGSLITFPSADDQKAKVRFIPVPGHYEKGGTRHNRAEAEEIVGEIRRRLKDVTLRSKSIGVISFSVAQQGLIEDLLQDALEKDRTLQEAAEQMYEPIFVKNLENVQGDERDVILFSVGYGPDKDGKVSMNFGPLNNAGGERRLNVAVSRAREEMCVFSTLKASDIDLRRSKAKGVEGLKHFLEYAETSNLPLSSTTYPVHKDAELAGQIADELRKRGHSVRTDIGRSHFKVDIAVCDPLNPSSYILGILLDGKGYRDTSTTRDREIVQPSVLSGLKWQTMRVWTLDWYNNRERVLSRIEEKIASIPESRDEAETGSSNAEQFSIGDSQIEEYSSAAAPYIFCEMSTAQAKALSDAALMKRIITAEQPVTFAYLCRRVSVLRDSGRVTPTLKKSLTGHLPVFHQDGDGSIWLSAADRLGYSGYRTASGRDVTDIPRIEICNALLEALSEQVSISLNGLLHVTSKKLGYSKVGANVQSVLEEAVRSLEAEGRIGKSGENYRLCETAGSSEK